MSGLLAVVVGEGLVDIVDEGQSPYLTHAGGSPLNVAVGLSRLGHATAFAGRLSTDPIGTLLRGHALASGVDMRFAINADEPSTTALVQLRGGDARYQFNIDGAVDFQWSDSELAALPSDARMLHFGSLASWLPPGAAAIARLVARTRAGGRILVSYDPNVRPTLQPDARAARTLIEQTIAISDIVKASEDDVRYLYGEEPLDQIAARWATLGAILTVITRGGDGAVAFIPGWPPQARPPYRLPVVDTVGAGDAFMSGLLGALADHRVTSPADLLAAVREPALISELVDKAALVAALTCSRAGATPPWAEEVNGLDRSEGRNASDQFATDGSR